MTKHMRHIKGSVTRKAEMIPSDDKRSIYTESFKVRALRYDYDEEQWDVLVVSVASSHRNAKRILKKISQDPKYVNYTEFDIRSE